MADFTWKPHRVEPTEPEYNVRATDMEGMRKKTRLISSRPKRAWMLYFRVQTQEEYDDLLNHYKGQQGIHIPFNWVFDAIPFHVNSFSEPFFHVRYTEFKSDPLGWGVWNINMKFEETI